jgi:hypothetical protein
MGAHTKSSRSCILTVSNTDYRRIMWEKDLLGKLMSAIVQAICILIISTTIVFFPLQYFGTPGFEQINAFSVSVSATIGFFVTAFTKILFDINYPKLLSLLAHKGLITKPVVKVYDFRSGFTDEEKKIYLDNGWDGKTYFMLEVEK